MYYSYDSGTVYGIKNDASVRNAMNNEDYIYLFL